MAAAKASDGILAVSGGEWNQKVTVKLPRSTDKHGENYLYVAVNGRGMKIMRGVSVDVPKPIAEVLKNSEEMQDIAADYAEKATSV